MTTEIHPERSNDSPFEGDRTATFYEAADPSDDMPLLRDIPGASRLITSLPADHSGTAIYIKGWRLEHSPRPSFVFVHDLGEHADLYQAAAIELLRRGHSMHAFDMRGHGRSGQRLGHASFEALVKDLLQVAAWVRHLDRGRPPIILGQGIGALVAMEFARTYGHFCRGIVLSAPCLEPLAPIPLVIRALIRTLAELAPTLRLPRALTPKWSAEPSEANSGGEGGHDLARSTRLSAAFAMDLLSALRRVEAGDIEYSGPILALCPSQDGICAYTRIKRMALDHSERTFQIVDLEAVGHNVFTGSAEARATALAALLAWVNDLERSQNAETSSNAALRSSAPADVSHAAVDESPKLELADL